MDNPFPFGMTANDYYELITLAIARLIKKAGGGFNVEAQAAYMDLDRLLREALCLPLEPMN
ncbi:hypothetical protein D5I55_08040 [Chakrabartia godavariana]|nr:hypothetical protein D5I55_08040 [Chakrabartia godavariana]